MTDLVKQWDEYVESMGSVMGEVEHMAQQMADSIDALAAKLAEVEAERDHWETVGIARQARGIVIAQKLDAAEARMSHLENHIEGVAKDTHKIMVAYEAALPAAYRLGLGAGANAVDEIIADRIYFLTRARADDEQFSETIRALPTLTAAELMARIQTGEKE